MRHVTVIDDDAALLHALRFMLELEGFAAATYPDAHSFLAHEGEPDTHCLVIDQRMPGMSGIELTAHLRQRGKTMPIIVMSGVPNQDLKARALAAGADIVLEKPLHENTLGDALKSLLSRH